MKQALEALELTADRMQKQRDAITALRAAIAEAVIQRFTDVQQEIDRAPVAWMYKGEPDFDGNRWHDNYCVTTDEQVARFKDKGCAPLYTHPPRREWVGLTDDEIEDCWDGYLSDYQLEMIRAIEAKLKERNK